MPGCGRNRPLLAHRGKQFIWRHALVELGKPGHRPGGILGGPLVSDQRIGKARSYPAEITLSYFALASNSIVQLRAFFLRTMMKIAVLA